MNPVAKFVWSVVSKVAAPITLTAYTPGQRVELDGQQYLVRRIVTPEADFQIREPMVEIHLLDDEGIQHHRMAERVLDLRRAGKIGSEKAQP